MGGRIISTQDIIGYFNQYGLIFVLGIMYLEGLNLTGIPAVALLPAIGGLARVGSYPFIVVFLISIIGSMLGNLTYYFVVRAVGPKIYDYFYNKFKGIRKSLDRAKKMSIQYGNKVCFLGRLIPGVRTVISLLAGTFSIKLIVFFIYSLLGVSIWNLVLMLIGYSVGSIVL